MARGTMGEDLHCQARTSSKAYCAMVLSPHYQAGVVALVTMDIGGGGRVVSQANVEVESWGSNTCVPCLGMMIGLQ